jgi:hypothetical protein
MIAFSAIALRTEQLQIDAMIAAAASARHDVVDLKGVRSRFALGAFALLGFEQHQICVLSGHADILPDTNRIRNASF